MQASRHPATPAAHAKLLLTKDRLMRCVSVDVVNESCVNVDAVAMKKKRLARSNDSLSDLMFWSSFDDEIESDGAVLAIEGTAVISTLHRKAF